MDAIGKTAYKKGVPHIMASFFDDPAVAAFFAMRPCYEQKYLWCFTLTGEVTECTAHCHDYEPQRKAKRGTVTGFSSRSRLRLLKFASSVDWDSVTDGAFLTLTYPDGRVNVAPKLRTRHKYLFLRYMEKYLGREIGAMWRIEWVQRKSGERLGEIAPHIHLIMPNTPVIEEPTIREWWRKALNWKGYVDVDMRELNDRAHHAIYISKYCAKMPDTTVLGCVPYSHTRGRHWGYNRKPLIPMCKPMRFENVPWRVVEAIRWRVYQHLRPEQQDPCKGFVSFGMFGQQIKAFALNCLLDSGCVPV